jgi:hypothetical protein
VTCADIPAGSSILEDGNTLIYPSRPQPTFGPAACCYRFVLIAEIATGHLSCLPIPWTPQALVCYTW